MQSIKYILPTAVSHAVTTAMISEVQETTNGNESNSEVLWDPPADVSHLTLNHQNKVKQLLREECHYFSRSDDDIGCIKDLQLSISLTIRLWSACTLQFPSHCIRK